MQNHLTVYENVLRTCLLVQYEQDCNWTMPYFGAIATYDCAI